MSGKIWKTHKFGGTSVQNAECIRKVAAIIQQEEAENTRLAVVVSALGGKPKVTQLLLDALQEAVAGNRWDGYLDSIREKHEQCVQELGLSNNVMESLETDFHDLGSLLHTASLLRYADSSIEGYVAGFGEQWSALIMSEFLGDRWSYVDARKVLHVKPLHQGQVSVCWSVCQELMDEYIAQLPQSQSLVITGYIATSVDTKGATTLGRDGSDHSASIFGVLLKSASITIWTDVSGVMSADPRRVRHAYVLPQVSYSEAAEMAFFGAKVIHPKTMSPAADHNIPLLIKNTFEPSHPGTMIAQTCAATIHRPEIVCGFSTVDELALISVEGAGMMGIPGVTHRVFGVIARVGVSVPLIAQASSEQSISFAVPQESLTVARDALLFEFRDEIATKLITDVSHIAPVSILAAVGDGMPHACGLAGHFFSALGHARVNILAIAQGAGERNLSAVVEQESSAAALKAVHSVFLSRWKIDVAIIGSDPLVAALCEGMAGRKTFRICATSAASEVEECIKNIADTDAHHRLIIDMSSDYELALSHTRWLSAGFHVITSNICAAGHPTKCQIWRQLHDFSEKIPLYSYDVALSHGMVPILSTLKMLRNSGDVITSIEGVFSVAISVIISCMEDGMSREEAICEAQRRGLTDETDVFQLETMKLLACAREMGEMVTLDALEQSALPDTLDKSTLKRCYVGRWTHTGGTLGLEELGKDHPLAQGVVVRIFSQNMPMPLVLQGSSSNQSTSAGILAQALRLCTMLDGWGHGLRGIRRIPSS